MQLNPKWLAKTMAAHNKNTEKKRNPNAHTPFLDLKLKPVLMATSLKMSMRSTTRSHTPKSVNRQSLVSGRTVSGGSA